MVFFLTTTRVKKVSDNGSEKKQSERNLFKAVNFADAETQTIEQLSAFYQELTVINIKMVEYGDVFPSDDEFRERWFEVVTSLIMLDERTGKESKTKYNVLVQAKDIDDAISLFHEKMKGSMMDYEVRHCRLTGIVEVHV